MKIKTQEQILKKLQIDNLNEMQQEAALAINSSDEVILLSPTGTGKTLAFLLPIIENLDPKCELVQAIIITPSRELSIQIEQVAREMGSGYKTNAFYGGRNFSKDRMELQTPPSILIGTPGRISDHLRRDTFDTSRIEILVLDEFDKSLEIGFEDEMEQICKNLKSIKKRILTSATNEIEIPSFVRLKRPNYVDYLAEGVPQLNIKRIVSPEKDKLKSLIDALCHIGEKTGIIFCNYKDSIKRVSDFLSEYNIDHGCYYGAMEQKDRERALIKFRNGTHRLIIATDLAARGLDIPELEFILHYHLPSRSQDFVHRNGRTARMHKEGTAYVLHWKEEVLPDFINTDDIEKLGAGEAPSPTKWSTLFISGGRKDKISKGDIVGLFLKQGNLENGEVGNIELKQDCAFVAIPKSKAKSIVKQLNNSRLKKKKVRIFKI